MTWRAMVEYDALHAWPFAAGVLAAGVFTVIMLWLIVWRLNRKAPGAGHIYLSTACEHAGEGTLAAHVLCRVQCKFCPARCICDCHPFNHPE